jgi:hypothetical protein
MNESFRVGAALLLALLSIYLNVLEDAVQWQFYFYFRTMNMKLVFISLTNVLECP